MDIMEDVDELFDATELGDVRRVEKLMQCGINPGTITKDGASPIHAAAVLEAPAGPKIIKRMLSYGADPNIKTDTGLSPLHIASMWGRVDTINVLLDHGADVAEKDFDDMSALDYAEDAEECKEECIDALTKYRSSPRRKSGCFLTKSRYNLDRILGGHELFTTFDASGSSEDSICNKVYTKSISTQTDEVETGVKTQSDDRSDFELEVQVESKPAKTRGTVEIQLQDPSCSDKNISFLEEDSMFKTCKEFDDENIVGSQPCSHIASSTMIDESVIFSDSQCDRDDNRQESSVAMTSTGYKGDISFESEEKELDQSDFNETFWSVWSTPPRILSSQESPITFRKKPCTHQTSTEVKKENTNNRGLFFNNDGSTNVNTINDEMLIKNLSNLLNNTLLSDDDSHDNVDKDDDSHDNDDKDDDSEREEHHISSYKSIENEVTIDYSSANVSQLVEYYEQKHEDDVTKHKSPSGSFTKSPYIDVVNLREVENGSVTSCHDYSGLTIDYDWKDVSFVGVQRSDEGDIGVPSHIMGMTNEEIRTRLKEMGENPGPVSESTRKVYERYLARLEKVSEHNKPPDKFTDYTTEMRQALCGRSKPTITEYEDLEVEMGYLFQTPDKHTWREGTQKTSFNYLLLDPRVTNNLPSRCKCMSFEEQLRVFVAAIFYIGKGKKSRPYEHFHEALKHENGDHIPHRSKKMQMISEIWSSGMGVAAVHIFHSIIPVEAYTREACMIEAMGLSRLTNMKLGDYYGPAASWNIKRKRMLGVHLISKAMKIYLIEGERQIRKKDITNNIRAQALSLKDLNLRDYMIDMMVIETA